MVMARHPHDGGRGLLVGQLASCLCRMWAATCIWPAGSCARMPSSMHTGPLAPLARTSRSARPTRSGSSALWVGIGITSHVTRSWLGCSTRRRVRSSRHPRAWLLASTLLLASPGQVMLGVVYALTQGSSRSTARSNPPLTSPGPFYYSPALVRHDSCPGSSIRITLWAEAAISIYSPGARHARSGPGSSRRRCQSRSGSRAPSGPSMARLEAPTGPRLVCRHRCIYSPG